MTDTTEEEIKKKEKKCKLCNNDGCKNITLIGDLCTICNTWINQRVWRITNNSLKEAQYREKIIQERDKRPTRIRKFKEDSQ